MCLGPVRGPFGPGHARAVGAAVESAVRLHAMADHLHTPVLACRSECVDGALEAVEGGEEGGDRGALLHSGRLGRSPAKGVTLGGTDVRLEEAPVLGGGVAHFLRVPLHGDQPPIRKVAGLHRFYYPVRRAGGRDQVTGEVLNPLVVVGVDLGASAYDPANPGRMLMQLDLVRGLPVWRVLLML